MMRWFFLLLVMLNLFYFVWNQQQAPVVPREVEAMTLPRSAGQGIRLLAEDSHKRDMVQSGGVAASTEQACLYLGGFALRDQALALEQRLLSVGVQVELLALEASGATDYWVYLAPLGSAQASLRQLRELQARKIDSYVISQGDLANGISLGIFPRKDSAESVMARLRSAGYEPLMRELVRGERSFWLRVAPQSKRLLSEQLLNQLSNDFNGLENQLMPCEGIASVR